MSNPDRSSDIERLLAEAEGVLGGGRPPAVPEGHGLERSSGGLSASVRRAAIAATAAAAVIWVVFALLPFLRAPSGALAAFASTFITVLVLRRR